jgi:hypothetical protein
MNLCQYSADQMATRWIWIGLRLTTFDVDAAPAVTQDEKIINNEEG